MTQNTQPIINNNSEIRIYVACLAAYNNGILHGAWIDANQDENAIHDEIAEILKTSPIKDAEEYAIHDYEGFEGVQLSEYSGISEVVELAAFISEHGELGAETIIHFGDIEAAEMALNDLYHGEYRSLAEFAEQLTEDTTQIPENLRFYIDYEAMARDLEISDVIAIETGFEAVHVFWSH
ncbi:antirestriction protein ArdA [Lentilitoribacter sp. EG35]|uniref:antirestriction protein ArdA n=1 Tax=Lentilitoribacter sp. EG35 TaxID=3234192 RepID=UPI00345F3B70